VKAGPHPSELLWSWVSNWKTLRPIVRLGSSLSAADDIINLVHDEKPQILGHGGIGNGYGKVGDQSRKAAKRGKITSRSYRPTYISETVQILRSH